MGRIQEDGKFIYISGTEGGAVREMKYNLLRHAGAVYALAIFDQHFPSEHARDLIVRATKFLVDKSVRSVEQGDLKAIFAVPELTHKSGDPVAPLGGTGLGLSAILMTETLAKGSTDPATIRSLGEFLLSMQKPDGEFYSKYTLS